MSDAYNGRIPRQLTVFGMLLSQFHLVYSDSFRAGVISLITAFGLMIILYPLFMIGALGAGDIKLMMILPAYMNLSMTLKSVMFAFLAGAVIGLIKLIRSGTLKKRILKFTDYLIRALKTGRIEIYDIPASKTQMGIAGHQIHFSIPVLIGCAMATGGYISI